MAAQGQLNNLVGRRLRSLGSDGSLRGYGWGLEKKAWLLEHEAGGLERSPAPRHQGKVDVDQPVLE